MNTKIFFILISCHYLIACQNDHSPKPDSTAPAPAAFSEPSTPKKSDTEITNNDSNKWHEDIHFFCKDQDCLPGLVMIIKKGYGDDPGSAVTCLGYLSSPDTVVTSTACLPPMYSEGTHDCKDKIVVKFPSVGESVSEETIHCQSILKRKELSKSEVASTPKDMLPDKKEKLSLKSEFAIVKLESKVNRKPISRHEDSLSYLNPHLKIEEKYLMSTLELYSNSNSKFSFRLASISCTTLRNKKFILNEPADAIMIDCGKERPSPGSPVYSTNTDNRGKIVGIVSNESLASSRYFEIDSNSRYFAFDLSCVDKKDCSVPSIENHFYDKDFTQNSISEVNESSGYRKWLLRQTMNSAIEFEWVNNFQKNQKTLEEVVSLENIQKTVIASLSKSKSQISLPLPKCIKTINKQTWHLGLSAQPWLQNESEEIESQHDFARALRLHQKDDSNLSLKPGEVETLISGSLNEKLILLVQEDSVDSGIGYFRKSDLASFDIEARLKKSPKEPKKIYVELFLYSYTPRVSLAAKVPLCNDIE